MKVLEYEARALLAAGGMRIPAGHLVTTPEAARAAAQRIGGPVVIKAQIPSGGRMKAGGVRFASSPEEASAIAGDLLGQPLLGHLVERALVEARLDICEEVFVGVTYDARARRPIVLASRAGGIDVEAGQALTQRAFSVLHTQPVPDYIRREVAAELGFAGQPLLRLAAVIRAYL